MSTAVRDAEVTRARVGGVGASVVLDGAATLDSSTFVHKRGTVHREGTLRIARVSDSRGGSSEVASEGLNVVSRGRSVVTLTLAADTALSAALE